MAVDTARRLLDLERSGLPVIFAGALPTATPGFHDAAGQDAELRRLIAELLKRPGAHRVTDLAAVPGLLAELEIKPAADSLDAVGRRAQRPPHRPDHRLLLPFQSDGPGRPSSG